MKNYVSINSISIGKLNNAEYVNYLTRFYNIIIHPLGNESESPDEVLVLPPPFGISQEEMNQFNIKMNYMTDLISESYIKDETQRMKDLDKQRDEIIVYITSHISIQMKSPLTEQGIAAIAIYNRIKPYIGIYKKANQQKTVQIRGLLLDLSKNELKQQVQLLNLAQVIALLDSINEEYAKLTEKRYNYDTLEVKENSKTLRKSLSAIYRSMVGKIYAFDTLTPTVESSTCVLNINTLISETNARYKQRMALIQLAKEKKKTD